MNSCRIQLVFSIGLVLTLLLAAGVNLYAAATGKPIDVGTTTLAGSIVTGIFAILQRPAAAAQQTPELPPGTKQETSEQSKTTTTTEP